MDLLTGLVDKSLVAYSEDEQGSTRRHRLPENLAHCAAERQEQDPDETPTMKKRRAAPGGRLYHPPSETRMVPTTGGEAGIISVEKRRPCALHLPERTPRMPDMKRCLIALLSLLLLLTGPACSGSSAAPSTISPKTEAAQVYPPERAAQWEKSIAAFEQKDRTSGAPAPGGILFVGSSTIVGWRTLATDFPGLPTINRGFGGSQIQDATHFADRIVLPYKPNTIVFYSGDNDIAAGHTPERVFADFQAFALKVRAALPDTRIIFLAIKPSPSRWQYEEKMLAANAAIERWMRTQPNMLYLDVHTPMLGPDGQPRPELYVADRLHMSPEGYRLWTGIVAPYLK